MESRLWNGIQHLETPVINSEIYGTGALLSLAIVVATSCLVEYDTTNVLIISIIFSTTSVW